MLVDHIVVVEGTFVGEVVRCDGKTSRKVDGLPVDPSDQSGIPGEIFHGSPEEASQFDLSCRG